MKGSRKIKYSSDMIGKQTKLRKYNSPRLVDKVAKDPEFLKEIERIRKRVQKLK